MANLVWVEREEGFWQDPVDLDGCSRFFIPGPDEDPEADVLVHYLAKDERWIENLSRFDGGVRTEKFEFVNPIDVAYSILRHGGPFPKEFNDMDTEKIRRTAGDWDCCRKWRRERRAPDFQPPG